VSWRAPHPPIVVAAEQIQREVEMIPFNVVANQVYPLAMAITHPKSYGDKLIPLAGREQTIVLWEDMTDKPKTRYRYGWNENFMKQARGNVRKNIFVTQAGNNLFVDFEEQWYGIMKNWCIDPYILDAEEPKELLAAVFDDLINRPPPLWEWYDYKAPPKLI
jgi:hypothetical protein